MTLAFVSAGAAEALVRACAADVGIPVAGRFGAVGAMLEALESGEHADIVILTRAQIDALAAHGRVFRETVTDLGTVATSIAVRIADAPPDVSSAAALKSALLAADEVHFPDPRKSTAGVHFAGVIERLDIAKELAGRLRQHPNGRLAMRMLAESHGRAIGCTQATEILATPGLRLAGSLPAGLDLETVYTAAVDVRTADRSAAHDFLRRLGGPAEAARRSAAGFH